MNSLKAIVLIVLTLGLLVTGCSGGTGQVAVTGKSAPDFQFTNPDGQSVSLSDFQGKGVIINFWATWCGPCRSEMPHLQQIYDEWSGNGLVMLAVNIGESPSTVSDFMERYGFSFPVLLDRGGKVDQLYGVRRLIPTTFFIDKDGIIRDKVIGAFQNKAQIEERLGSIIP